MQPNQPQMGPRPNVFNTVTASGNANSLPAADKRLMSDNESSLRRNTPASHGLTKSERDENKREVQTSHAVIANMSVADAEKLANAGTPIEASGDAITRAKARKPAKITRAKGRKK